MKKNMIGIHMYNLEARKGLIGLAKKVSIEGGSKSLLFLLQIFTSFKKNKIKFKLQFKIVIRMSTMYSREPFLY